MAAYQRQVAAQNRQQKMTDLRQLITEFQAILTVHRADFPPAERPVAEWQPVPSAEALYPEHERQALNEVSALKLKLRKEARTRARAAADAHHDQLAAEAVAAHDLEQEEMDAWWTQLLANEPGTVLEALEDAFEDNEAPAAAVGVSGNEVAVVVLAPELNVIPEKWPEITSAGNPSMKPLAKGKRISFYNLLLLGQVLVTIRETFAVAAGMASVRIVLIRATSPNVYGKKYVECLTAARFERKALEGVQWDIADAPTIFNDVASEKLFKQVGAAGELKPLDLSDEPELQALVAEVDLSELEDA